MVTERDGCKPLLYQLRVSRVVCGPLFLAPPTSPHSCVWPSSRAPSHSPSPLSRAQEQRRDSSPSSFDGRTPRASPSRTRGLGHHISSPQSFNSLSSRNPTLQLSEFEETPSLPPPPKHLRSTTAALAHWLASYPDHQRFSFVLPPSTAYKPIPSIDYHRPTSRATYRSTVLLTDLEVGLPQHQTTISALRLQFEAHIRFLRINLESYIALQLSITDALHEQQPPSDPVQATAYPLPPEPFDTPHTSRQGRFRFYARSAQRTNNRHLQLLGRLPSLSQQKFKRISRFPYHRRSISVY
jgi:hypothetical protein